MSLPRINALLCILTSRNELLSREVDMSESWEIHVTQRHVVQYAETVLMRRDLDSWVFSWATFATSSVPKYKTNALVAALSCSWFALNWHGPHRAMRMRGAHNDRRRLHREWRDELCFLCLSFDVCL